MSLDLEANMIEKAVEERNAILEKASTDAKKILENAKKEEKRLNEDVERHLKTILGSEIKSVHDRIVGKANLEGRKLVMNAKMELIDSVFESAKKTLKELANKGSPEYEEIIKKLIKEAANSIGEDKLLISSNKSDQVIINNTLPKMSKELNVNLKLESKTIDTIGGVILKNTEGTKVYFNTLENRLSYVRESKLSEVAEKLGVI